MLPVRFGALRVHLQLTHLRTDHTNLNIQSVYSHSTSFKPTLQVGYITSVLSMICTTTLSRHYTAPSQTSHLMSKHYTSSSEILHPLQLDITPPVVRHYTSSSQTLHPSSQTFLCKNRLSTQFDYEVKMSKFS